MSDLKGRCGGCKHWATTHAALDKPLPGVGICESINEWNGVDEPRVLVNGWGGGDYSGWFVSTENFGCTLFEPREEAKP